MAHLTERRGDTVHLDVIDRRGNMVAATPSGGWLQSSPVVPGLGFPLNSRAQMFWLEEGLPTSLAPGRRPRTTLTPSLRREGRAPPRLRHARRRPAGPVAAVWFLRFVHHGLDLQEGMDAPLFHSMHFQGSFYPREAKPGAMMIEPSFGEAVIAELRARGHDVTVSRALVDRPADRRAARSGGSSARRGHAPPDAGLRGGPVMGPAVPQTTERPELHVRAAR